METVHFYILAGLSGISVALCAILLFRVKNVLYLLEQPVVKKMSPALKLKPVKIDEMDDEARRNQARNAPPANGSNLNRPPRPAMERTENGQDRSRDPQSRTDRQPRHERERTENSDRGPRNDRNDRDGRGDRDGRFRDRDRIGGPRHERNDRHGGENRSRRPEVFTNEKEGETAPIAPRPAPMMGVSENAGAPPHSSPSSSGPALAPRRPLAATVDHDAMSRDLPVNESPALRVNEDAGDAAFVGRGGDDSDIQHGRRNQLKKKPRFNEEEVKPAPEEFKA